MSTIRSFGNALHFHPERASRAVFWRLWTAVRTYWSAVRDGLAASRAYHELTAQGANHEEAVEKVFDRHFSVPSGR